MQEESLATLFVCKHLAKYCRVCDAAPQTFEVMSDLTHLMVGLKGVDLPGPPSFPTVIERVVTTLQSEFEWSEIGLSLADLLIAALILTEKGFANSIFIHSQTAAR